MDEAVLKEKAEMAKAFIYKNKSATAQCSTIIDLVNRI